jgi:hypothetical protein
VGKTLRRYVLSEILGVLFLGLVLTTFVLATVQILDLVDLAFAKGVPASRVLRVFGYMIPSYLELTFPMALLLSIVAGIRPHVARRGGAGAARIRLEPRQLTRRCSCSRERSGSSRSCSRRGRARGRTAGWSTRSVRWPDGA